MNLSFILCEDKPAALLFFSKFVNISKGRAQHAMYGLIRKEYICHVFREKKKGENKNKK
jgi:hypothetical protein